MPRGARLERSLTTYAGSYIIIQMTLRSAWISERTRDEVNE